MKTYVICQSCGDRTYYAIEPAKTPNYCSNCSTAEKRKRVEEENKIIRENFATQKV